MLTGSFITWSLTTCQSFSHFTPYSDSTFQKSKILKIFWDVQYLVPIADIPPHTYTHKKSIISFSLISTSPFPYNVYHDLSDETFSDLLKKTSSLLIANSVIYISLYYRPQLSESLPFKLHIPWGECIIYLGMLKVLYKV